jgi:hypothetical protein
MYAHIFYRLEKTNNILRTTLRASKQNGLKRIAKKRSRLHIREGDLPWLKKERKQTKTSIQHVSMKHYLTFDFGKLLTSYTI